MKVPFVDLYAQFLTIQSEINNSIENTIKNTDFIGGKQVSDFEAGFASFVGVKHCIACANGTDSIEIILQALGIGRGDEVIVPAHSWISTSEAVSFIGAKPVFVDTHPDYYTILPEKIEAVITPRTKAIMPVHLYGQAAPLSAIISIAEKHGLKVIEDCAQAHGAQWEGKNIGSMGIASSFSFYPGKNLGAYGDAGAIVTNDTALAEKIRMIANHGQKGKHNHLMEGRNSRLDALHAGILNVKLPYVHEWNQKRFEAAMYYNEKLNGTVKIPQINSGATHVFHLYVIQVENRSDVMEFLTSKGIQTAIHYPKALPFLPCYNGHYDLTQYSNSGLYQDRILSLPMYAEITREQQDYVVSCLKEIVR